jgi:very-short-patch-repair endonuclease
MHPFNPKSKLPRLPLTAIAHGLRGAPTTSEARLWSALRFSQLRGAAFRRQVVIGSYIVDLFAPTHRLVVEVDGGCHEQRQRHHARRDRAIGRLGYQVLRLSATLVMRELGQALARIEAALAGR